MKHMCASFTGFGQRCSVSTLTSKSEHSGKVNVVGPCVQSDRQSGRDTSRLSAQQAHNNVTEWRNESMEKTHNPHYKGFWHLIL